MSSHLHHDIMPTMQSLEDPCAGTEEKSKGAFVRKESQHRNWIKADGSTDFRPEAGRYHLYVANGCPWCHRSVHAHVHVCFQGSADLSLLLSKLQGLDLGQHKLVCDHSWQGQQQQA